MILFNPLLGEKGVNTFSKGMSPSVNVLSRLEFELTHNDVAINYTAGNSHCSQRMMRLFTRVASVLRKIRV